MLIQKQHDRCMNQEAYNYLAAFTSFVEGASIEEVSREHDIPMQTLYKHVQRHNWRALADRMNARKEADLQPMQEQWALEKCAENRKKNLQRAERLYQQVDKILEAIETKNEPMSPKTLRDLVCAATTILEMSYRASGDGQGGKMDSMPPEKQRTTAIQINLPAIIATPRSTKRVINIESDRPETTHEPPPQS